MPQRPERFFWLYIKQVNQAVAANIDIVNQQFAGSWTACGLRCTSCVSSQAVSDRLWLFRLETTKKKVATNFNRQLMAHIKGLGSQFGLPQPAKRQTNLPQPLVCPRVAEKGTWWKTDVGLHSVNDPCNGMLVTYTYHEGRRYYVPHLQLCALTKLCQKIELAWKGAACSCWRSASGCCGVGCFDCFQTHCADCDGTGWKDFSRWVRRGYQVDYSSGLPMALV